MPDTYCFTPSGIFTQSRIEKRIRDIIFTKIILNLYVYVDVLIIYMYILHTSVHNLFNKHYLVQLRKVPK